MQSCKQAVPTMAPAFRRSGSRYWAPSLTSHQIFSHVTITSPNAASTMGLPESRADTLGRFQSKEGYATANIFTTVPPFPALSFATINVPRAASNGAGSDLQIVS